MSSLIYSSVVNDPFLQSELISIDSSFFGSTELSCVDLRDVHAFIESKRHFYDWAKDRLQDFSEDIDFIQHKKMLSDNKTVDTIDYIVTLEVAKHICIMERTEKARALRKNLFEIERKYLNLLEEHYVQKQLLEKETSELRKERDDALALLKKSTHNRISTYCKNEETGKMELTSKDRLLVDLQQKWAGQYILHATALSQTIHMMKALNIPLPTNFLLKDGREFFATYTEPCCEEKPTKASDIAKVIMGNGQDLFDFMR